MYDHEEAKLPCGPQYCVQMLQTLETVLHPTTITFGLHNDMMYTDTKDVYHQREIELGEEFWFNNDTQQVHMIYKPEYERYYKCFVNAYNCMQEMDLIPFRLHGVDVAENFTNINVGNQTSYNLTYHVGNLHDGHSLYYMQDMYSSKILLTRFKDLVNVTVSVTIVPYSGIYLGDVRTVNGFKQIHKLFNITSDLGARPLPVTTTTTTTTKRTTTTGAAKDTTTLHASKHTPSEIDYQTIGTCETNGSNEIVNFFNVY